MYQELKAKTKQLMDRVDEMSLRERGMIFIALLAVLYVFAYQVLFTPLFTEQKRLQSQIQAKHKQIQVLESQIQAVVRGGERPDASKLATVEALEQRLQALDDKLAAATSGLVSPKQMARVVEEILTKNRRLRLIRVQNLMPAPLVDDPSVGRVAGSRHSAPVIYKHGARIEVEGSYLEMVKYLRALEQLPWKMFWGEVSLKSQGYPVSRLKLVIYTLSTNENWIAI